MSTPSGPIRAPRGKPVLSLAGGSHPSVNRPATAGKTTTGGKPSHGGPSSQEDHLSKLQSRLDSSEAARIAAQRRAEDLATEVRLSSLREGKLRAKLESVSSSGPSSSSSATATAALEEKLSQLQRLHEESKEKQRVRMAEMRGEIEGLRAGEAKVRKRLEVVLPELEAARARAAQAQAQVQTQKKDSHAGSKLREVERELAAQREEVGKLRAEMVRREAQREEEEEEHEEELRRAETNQEVLLRSGVSLGEELREVRAQNGELRWGLALVRAETAREQQEAERARAELDEERRRNEALRERNAFLEEEMRRSGEVASRYETDAGEDSTTTPPPTNTDTHSDTHLLAALAAQSQVTHLSAELDLTTGRLYHALSELSSLHATHLSALSSLKDVSHTAENAFSRLGTLEGQCARTAEALQRTEAELREVRSTLQKEERARAEEEERRGRSERSVRTWEEKAKERAREAAMMGERVRASEEEKQDLLQALSQTTHYQTLYTSLLSQSRALISRLGASESALEELSGENALLASHANPVQKILYVDNLRRRVEEGRREVEFLREEGERYKARVRELEGEVRCLKGFGRGGRVRRLGVGGNATVTVGGGTDVVKHAHAHAHAPPPVTHTTQQRAVSKPRISAGAGAGKGAGAVAVARRRSSLLIPFQQQQQQQGAVRRRASRVPLTAASASSSSSSSSSGSGGDAAEWSSDVESAGEEYGEDGEGRSVDEPLTMHELKFGSPRK